MIEIGPFLEGVYGLEYMKFGITGFLDFLHHPLL
jgi:hypothetical protein